MRGPSFHGATVAGFGPSGTSIRATSPSSEHAVDGRGSGAAGAAHSAPAESAITAARSALTRTTFVRSQPSWPAPHYRCQLSSSIRIETTSRQEHARRSRLKLRRVLPANTEMRKILEQRGLRFIFLANIVSMLGSGMNSAAITWFILQRTHNEMALGTLVVLSTLPGMVMLPFTGV